MAFFTFGVFEDSVFFTMAFSETYFSALYVSPVLHKLIGNLCQGFKYLPTNTHFLSARLLSMNECLSARPSITLSMKRKLKVTVLSSKNLSSLKTPSYPLFF